MHDIRRARHVCPSCSRRSHRPRFATVDTSVDLQHLRAALLDGRARIGGLVHGTADRARGEGPHGRGVSARPTWLSAAHSPRSPRSSAARSAPGSRCQVTSTPASRSVRTNASPDGRSPSRSQTTTRVGGKPSPVPRPGNTCGSASRSADPAYLSEISVRGSSVPAARPDPSRSGAGRGRRSRVLRGRFRLIRWFAVLAEVPQRIGEGQ